MDVETVGEKIVLKRTPEEKTQCKARLNRAEGQVRGLKQMIDDNRPWGEFIQQSSAVIAALREVAVLVVSHQLQGQVASIDASQRNGLNVGHGPNMTEFVETLRTSFRFV